MAKITGTLLDDTIVGGYGIIEAPDIDAAVAIASSWAGTLPITIEVRPVQVMNER